MRRHDRQSRGPQSQTVLVGALSGLVTAAVIAVACGGPPPSAEPSSGPMASNPGASQTSDPSFVLQGAQVGVEWSRHDLGVDRPRRSVIGVGGAGIAAIVEGDQQQMLAWSSPDGILWTGPQASTGLDRGVSDIQPHGQGFLAVGRFLGAGGVADAAAWTSPDGLTWSRVPDQASLGPSDDNAEIGMRSVAAGPRGYVAIGFEKPDPTADEHGVAWTSRDGITWERTATIDADLSGLASGAGGYIAVGQKFDRADGAIWTSPDGITWTDRSSDPDLVNADVRTAVSGGPGLLAVGASYAPGSSLNQSEPAIWASTDGVSWDRVALQAHVADQGDGMFDIVAIDSTLVVVGDHRTPSDVRTAVAWTSPDGLTWTRSAVDVVEGAGLYEVEAIGGRVVGIGPALIGTSIWISPPAQVANAPAALTPPPLPPGADEFFTSFCAMEADLKGALPLDEEGGPPEAMAWLVALEEDDPNAIVKAAAPIRARLLSISKAAKAETAYAPGVQLFRSAGLLSDVLLANLERIEKAARAGAMPEAGLYTYVDEVAVVALQAYGGYRSELPEEPPC